MTTAQLREVLPVVGVNPARGRPRVRALLARPLLRPADLVVPLLVQPDDRPIDEYVDLPGAVPASGIPAHVTRLANLGIRAVKIFAYVTDKTPDAQAAYRPDNILAQAIRAVRATIPDMVISTEVCGCAWTSHGECVLLHGDGRTDLPSTLEMMRTMAVSHAIAGADIIGPAGMVDGAVAAIRDALDRHDFRDVGITPSVIFSSALFDVYKQAMDTDPARGDRRGFQIDPCHPGQAVAQARRWLDEGADALLVQPALTAGDLLTRLAAEVDVPITAFSVTGEHTLLAANPAVYAEYTQYLKRAGADLIMTYGAETILKALEENPC